MSRPMSDSAEVQGRAALSRRPSGEWLRPLSGDWPSAVCRELEVASAVSRVVVVSAQGSSPREQGTSMLVTAQSIVGTIGGGHLEWQAIQAARESIGNPRTSAAIHRLVLGTQLGQCCGGVVELWTERYTRRDLPLLRSASQAARSREPVLMASVLGPANITRRVIHAATPAFLPPQLRAAADALLAPDADHQMRFARMPASGGDAVLLERLNPSGISLWLYGAGHVGQAVVRAASELPFQITWIDSRAEFLPRSVPPNVRAMHTPSPVVEVANAPAGARHLVMTHDHGVDYELCRAILERNQFAWLGLIGSASKGAKFRARLRRDGVSDEAIARLVCPIGAEGVEGKAPPVIAIAVAAQLLQPLSEAAENACSRRVAPAESVDARWNGIAPAMPQQVTECSGDNCASCASSRGGQA